MIHSSFEAETSLSALTTALMHRTTVQSRSDDLTVACRLLPVRRFDNQYELGGWQPGGGGAKNGTGDILQLCPLQQVTTLSALCELQQGWVPGL